MMDSVNDGEGPENIVLTHTHKYCCSRAIQNTR